jgi:hypothetical protein
MTKGARASGIAGEIETLRRFCDETLSRDERRRQIESLAADGFSVPEHQVVYESIRALWSKGPITVERLRVHLNNRGFPDIDVGNYFPPQETRGR